MRVKLSPSSPVSSLFLQETVAGLNRIASFTLRQASPPPQRWVSQAIVHWKMKSSTDLSFRMVRTWREGYVLMYTPFQGLSLYRPLPPCSLEVNWGGREYARARWSMTLLQIKNRRGSFYEQSCTSTPKPTSSVSKMHFSFFISKTLAIKYRRVEEVYHVMLFCFFYQIILIILVFFVFLDRIVLFIKKNVD